MTVFDTYAASDGTGGYAQPYCYGSITTGYDVYGNTYYSRTINGAHAFAGHETGHGQSIGHISNTDIISLMGYNPDIEVYFTPQPPDVNFVNVIYP